MRLFGLLVRDVPPHQDDLRARVGALAMACPAKTLIELVALYLPAGSISTLAAHVVATQNPGGAA